jgi:L-threonylcarbamoyladenylate synthase
MNKNLEKAIKVVRDGGIIIYPTDTAFGIGCRIDKVDSVRRLYKIRRRPSEKAVPVLVSSKKMAEEYASDIKPEAFELIEKYWPGGLTLVLRSTVAKVPEIVRGGGLTVGLRMPNHDSALELIRKVGVPIVGCSANFAGEATPYKMSDLNPELIKLVDFVLPGRTTLKKASTVVDLSSGKMKIIREGAVRLKS